MNALYGVWPWYLSGALIALVMFLLLKVNKSFGMSTNLETVCTMCGAGSKVSFFKKDWRNKSWGLFMLVGAGIGGYIAMNFLTINDAVSLHPDVVSKLNSMGFESAGSSYMPDKLFSNSVFTSFRGISILCIGGIMIGFGARYAKGCTSGHAITGLSNFDKSSLVAVIGFFVGGLTMVHIFFPLIFNN